MFLEEDLLQLSALQHLVFCERQCALIHLEGIWAENELTVRGQQMHEKVDSEEPVESRGDMRIVRGLLLRSFRLGLTGKADVVEFHRVGMDTEKSDNGVVLKGTSGRWLPFPVEYKRGKPKRDACDEVQLCAQALCIEEMLGVVIPAGALFYGKTRRRCEVAFDVSLREITEQATRRLHELFNSRKTPPAVLEPKCESCSLKNHCLPAGSTRCQSASDYMDQLWAVK